jgi:FkbM family methyltransferase
MAFNVTRELYELLGSRWKLRRGRGRWLNLLSSLLSIEPYGYLKEKAVGPYRLALDPGDENDRFYYFALAGWGYTHLVSRILRPGDDVLDIGANVGHFSATCARFLGSTGHVYAVEANPILVERLRSLGPIEGACPIYPYHFAISKTSGRQRFHVATVSGWSSTVANDTFTTATTLEVPAVTLDDFVQQQDIRHLRLLKLDIEGGEADALLGAKQILTRQLSDYFLIETERYRLQSFGKTASEIADRMMQHGYVPVSLIDSDRILSVDEGHPALTSFYGDTLYVTKSEFPRARELIFGARN